MTRLSATVMRSHGAVRGPIVCAVMNAIRQNGDADQWARFMRQPSKPPLFMVHMAAAHWRDYYAMGGIEARFRRPVRRIL